MARVVAVFAAQTPVSLNVIRFGAINHGIVIKKPGGDITGPGDRNAAGCRSRPPPWSPPVMGEGKHVRRVVCGVVSG